MGSTGEIKWSAWPGPAPVHSSDDDDDDDDDDNDLPLTVYRLPHTHRHVQATTDLDSALPGKTPLSRLEVYPGG